MRRARACGMTASVARKGMESIKYLGSPETTKEAVMRLKYWRDKPRLSDGMKTGNNLAMSEDIVSQIKGFYLIHQSLDHTDKELELLKRLNLVSLWTAVRGMGGEDDKKSLKEAKVSHAQELINFRTSSKKKMTGG